MRGRVRIWDLPMRIFHWVLVVSFFVAYWTEEEFLAIHTLAGYLVIALLVFRLLWGFTGGTYARFSSFICYPSESFAYLTALIQRKAPRYLGHNPAGSAMIVLMLSSIFLTVMTGLAVYGADQHAGPLAGLIRGNDDFWEESHEFFANLCLLLIFAHVCGVLYESWYHKENLIRSMFNGYKDPITADSRKAGHQDE